MRPALIVLTALMLVGTPAIAAESAMEAGGRMLLTKNCGACHAVGISDRSVHAEAPAFRTLGRQYDVSLLAEALAEGIMSGHPDMPVLAFDAAEVDQIIAYLESIQVD